MLPHLDELDELLRKVEVLLLRECHQRLELIRLDDRAGTRRQTDVADCANRQSRRWSAAVCWRDGGGGMGRVP